MNLKNREDRNYSEHWDETTAQFMINKLGKYQCNKCAHYLGEMKCKAFPEGISKDILVGEVLHQKPINGDSGIIFKKKSD